ncbi:GNAT family N-acetyltransferase [Arthrobacter flavus]|uniref:GNAT family N-acetyltransferase n=1 Tax=Arthrobacter flavus TaxID=95172 RepID=A0ABW4Q3F7_9MICC
MRVERQSICTIVPMTNSVKVRSADLEDVLEMVRMRHAVFRSMADAGAASRPEEIEDTSWYVNAKEAIAHQINRGTLGAFVIDAESSSLHPANAASRPLSACAIATLDERLPGPGFPQGLSGSMSSVFVEPTHRGRGYARLVVSAGISWLESRGAEVVDLHATPQATQLYRALGFTEPRSLSLRRVFTSTLNT